MDSAEPTLPPTEMMKPLPPVIQAALNAPIIQKRGWEWASGPFYIGLFLWIVYFDQIPRVSTAEGGVLWSALGVLLGGVLATLVLYRVPARLGFQTGQGLTIVATSTFGVRGVDWIPGGLQSLTSILWIAVSTSFASDLCLRGLIDLRLLEPHLLTPPTLANWTLPSPLVLVTAFFWALAASFTGLYLVRVIAALAKVFQIVPAVLIGICALRAFGGLPGFRPLVAANPEAVIPINLHAMLVAAQMVMGYFAVSGLTTVDWGAVSLTAKDVAKTGIVGVGFASTIIGVLAILTVAGAVGAQSAKGEPINPESLTFHGALPLLFGSTITAFLNLTFGLVALAPTCYAGYDFGNRMNLLAPRFSKAKWTWFAVFTAWLLIVVGIPSRLLLVFSFMGAIAGPIIGAMIADQYRNSSKWSGPRKGINWAGFVAVLVGFCVGAAPIIAEILGVSSLSRLQPATLYGVLASFGAYLVLAKLGLEPPPDDRPELLALTSHQPLP